MRAALRLFCHRLNEDVITEQSNSLYKIRVWAWDKLKQVAGNELLLIVESREIERYIEEADVVKEESKENEVEEEVDVGHNNDGGS